MKEIGIQLSLWVVCFDATNALANIMILDGAYSMEEFIHFWRLYFWNLPLHFITVYPKMQYSKNQMKDHSPTGKNTCFHQHAQRKSALVSKFLAGFRRKWTIALKILVHVQCEWIMKGWWNGQTSQKDGKIRKVGKKVCKMRFLKSENYLANKIFLFSEDFGASAWGASGIVDGNFPYWFISTNATAPKFWHKGSVNRSGAMDGFFQLAPQWLNCDAGH